MWVITFHDVHWNLRRWIFIIRNPIAVVLNLLLRFEEISEKDCFVMCRQNRRVQLNIPVDM